MITESVDQPQSESPREARTNLFAMATIYSDTGSMPVKIRNLSSGGARAEGPVLPSAGARIREQMQVPWLQDDEGLAVHFQPQINASGKIIGVESLFRWTHNSLGEIAAAEAVDVAEECGMIHALGEYVFRQAARFARLRPNLLVAINLSPAQFARSDDLPDALLRMAREEGVDPHQIELEITEQLFMHQGMGCEGQMEKLREHGFRLALDDFGTGYSSLSYLRRFKVDRLKLDKSFAQSDHTEENVALVRAAVALAHLFGLEVVAEGIETELQEAVALEGGCDALQGYRYAAAMTAGEFDMYIRKSLRSAA